MLSSSHDPRTRLHTIATRKATTLTQLKCVTVGAITQMPEFEKQFGVLDPILRGIVVAIILVPSAMASSCLPS